MVEFNITVQPLPQPHIDLVINGATLININSVPYILRYLALHVPGSVFARCMLTGPRSTMNSEEVARYC